MTPTRGKTCECKCARCGEMFTARVADRKRGWARFCSKSCKAIKQMHSMPARPARPHYISNEQMNAVALHDATAGWDDHKDWM